MNAYKILMIEDEEADYLLIRRHIQKKGFHGEIHWVRDAEGLAGALVRGGWHLVLSDYKVAGLDFPAVLDLVLQNLPDVPVIMVSGSVGEETAVDLLKKGLCDFVLKDRLERLVPAMERSLEERREKRKRREIEAELRKKEQLMAAILDGTPDAVFAKDLMGRYRLFNSAAARFTGQTAEGIIGKDDTHLFEPETAKAVMAQDRIIMSGGSLVVHEERILPFNKEERTFLVSKGPIYDEAGSVSGLFGISRDITERKNIEEALKASEACFRAYVESAPMAILVADSKGRFLDANPMVTTLLGYDKDTLLALEVSDIAPAEDLYDVRGDYRRMILTGHLEGEYRMCRSDGGIIWSMLKGVCIGEDRYMAYFQDITAQKEAERRRQFTTRLLELVHEHTDIQDLICEFVNEIKEFADCDAVGIRVLDDEGNIPYQAYNGFSPGFFESESPLSIKSDKCMCINVIKGDTDPSLPFYTPGGSFYMNGTTAFLATVSEKDKGETRNVCNAVGFESVALVPFRSEGRILGLIHVADRLENKVPLNLVETLERAIMQLGTAFQRFQARRAMRESEERLRSIIDNSGSIIWVKDLDGRFTVVNAYMLSALNLKSEEVLGKTVYDLFPAEVAREYADNDRQVIASGRALDVEERAVLPDGPHVFLSVKFPLRGPDGAVSAISAICTDITRIKAVEESLKVQHEKFRNLSLEYRVLLDNVPDGIVYLAPDGRIRWTNAAANSFFRMDGDAVCRGKICHEAFWGCESACPDCPVMKSVQTGRNENGEMGSSDDERKYEVRAVPIKDEAGTVKGVIEIIRDITEHRKLEQQFRQAQKMESIGTLAGGVAHDFNNILSAILGYGEIVLDTLDDDAPQREGMNAIIEAGLRAAHLTKDLLLFSRKQVSEKNTVDINSVIERIEKFIRRIIGEDIQCRTQLYRKPVLINADAHQIEQVLMNLATNARDAMPEGGVFTITTDITELDEDFMEAHGFGSPGRYVRMTVSDTGKGMERGTLDKMFEPFFTTKEMGKGTGLGLAVVYGIVRDHQGYIHAYSEPEHGTVFNVYLPVEEGKEYSAWQPIVNQKPAGGNEVILLAEDEVSVRKLFSTVLRRSGYTVIEAVDGEDAVRKFKEQANSVDLFVFDLVMPRLDGKKAFETIRELKSDVKGIFVSGYAPENIRSQDLFDLRAEVLYKPVSPRDLLSKVRRVLDGRKEDVYP